MNAAAVARPAATLVVVRDAADGPELLLLQRADKGDQNSGAWVFPGGLVDPADRHCHPFCAGPDDAAASALLGLAQGGLDFHIAAIRECFEEAGLLFAVDDHDQAVNLEGEAGARLASWRRPLQRGEREFADICRESGLRLAANRLHYIGHWVTPPGLPKRFDTRFFLALLPEGQASLHDSVETLDQVWLRPAAALAPEHARRLLKVTRHVIELVGRFADVATLLAWAQSEREVPMVMRLSPRVLRVTGSDGAGHNTYLVGDPQGGWAAIDPRPAAPAHLEALRTAAGGPIRWLALTGEDAAAGMTIVLGPGTTLRMVGAAAGPCCCLLVEEKTLFTGTLSAALARQLVAPEAVEWIAPGHGVLVEATPGGPA